MVILGNNCVKDECLYLVSLYCINNESSAIGTFISYCCRVNDNESKKKLRFVLQYVGKNISKCTEDLI